MKPNAETRVLYGEGLPLVCNAFNWCLAKQQKILIRWCTVQSHFVSAKDGVMYVQRYILLLMYAANQVAQHTICSDVMDSETNKILPVAVQHFIFVALCHFVLQYVEVSHSAAGRICQTSFFYFKGWLNFFFIPSTEFWLSTLDGDETVAFKLKMWSIFLIHVNIFVVRIGLIDLIKDLLGS